jgi:hypothetical protein
MRKKQKKQKCERGTSLTKKQRKKEERKHDCKDFHFPMLRNE